MSEIRVSAPAKINLYLKVKNRRPDGYHEIESLFMKVRLHDELSIQRAKDASFSIEVPGNEHLANENNLCVRAAREFLRMVGSSTGVHIQLTKKIPEGAGLGGGSSDAAAVLNALRSAYPQVGETEVFEMGRKLGADVPFFLNSAHLAYVGGIGDRIIPLSDLPSRPILLVYPGFGVATGKAYEALGRRLTSTSPSDNSFAPQKAPENWSDLEDLLTLGNDFQDVVEAMYPAIREARNWLMQKGASVAQMSGSGATVFGIFDDRRDMERALSDRNPKWITILTETLGPRVV